MVFSSGLFILFFLPIVYVINYVVKGKWFSNIVLLLSSLFFYAWGEPKLVLLLVISIVLNWITGIVIGKIDGKIRDVVLSIGIAFNLLLLGYYKYFNFFASTTNSLLKRDVIHIREIALPIGISFFTFQAISYIVDVYRYETEATQSIINVALYISFFPQLIAGPIVKYREINKQIERRRITWEDTSNGFKRFIYGLAKKVLIANVLGLCVDTIYGYDITIIDSQTAWIGAVAYTLQIYYDFSGYSDMAIGLGKMFGFSIKENFDYPYLSRSITEFWRRWHISLGSWFREYVYYPLGGSKKGKSRTLINLLIIFFLTGLWHGPDFSFVIWGLYHGFFIVAERMGISRILNKGKILPIIYVDMVVNFGWVLFRADDSLTGLRYISRMLFPWRHPDIIIHSWNYLDNKTIIIIIIGIIGMGIHKEIFPQWIKSRWHDSVPEAIYCGILLLLSVAALASNTYNPFIYFQF